jgi:tetratricopeptide (TPR) repeat protein
MTEEVLNSEMTGSIFAPNSQNRLLVCFIVAVCICVTAVYWPVLSAKALSYDDDQYLVENQYVQTPGFESAWKFLSEVRTPTTVGGYYQPLTMISLMADYAIGARSENPKIFHITSLLLHATNTCLIIILLYLLFEKPAVAAAAGLLFGVHPLTVEPIPWIGERKTLLAAFFSLWCLVLYVYYAKKGSRRAYIWCMVTYILALMSKPTSTPLPLVMLLLDFWPLKRLKLSSIREKIPLFIIGGISATITFISQSTSSSITTPIEYGIWRVPLVICHNIIFYLYKIVWPVNLTSHYAFPKNFGLSNPAIAAGVIGTAILIPLLLISLYRTRAALTGWLIFFIMILPTMQVLQFSDVIASDKFVYLPSTGILIALAAFLIWISGRHRRIPAIVTVIILILAGSETVATRKQLSHWRDSYTLFSYMVNLAPDDPGPRYNLGIILENDKGDIDGARREFEMVLKLKPGFVDGLCNLAGTYLKQDRFEEATEHYNELLKLDPRHNHAYSNLAYIQRRNRQTQRAIELYREGLKYNPNDTLLHSELGSLLLQIGQVDEAVPELEAAVKFKPNEGIYSNLGEIYHMKGQLGQAMKYYQKAIKLNPANAEAQYNLGNIYLAKNQLSMAIYCYDKAIKARPTYAKAYCNKGVAFSEIGVPDRAMAQFRKAIELEPNSVDAYFNLANIMADNELTDGAVVYFKKVIELSPQEPAAHLRLAELLLQKGQAEQAIAEYEKVLKIDPSNTDAQAGLQNARNINPNVKLPNP